MNCKQCASCFLFIIMLFIFSFSAKGFQSPHPGIIVIEADSSKLRPLALLPKQIREASGLELTRGKYLWTHNDDGVPALYCLDTLGKLVKTLHLNHPNGGWEDLTQDNKGNLYIGAFGNNENDKRSLKIYKIPDPDAIHVPVYDAAAITYRYGDQHAYPPPPSQRNFDMDAMMAKGDSLFLFTKNRTSPFTGYTKIYHLPQQPGQYTILPVDSIYLGNGPMMDHWVTSAALSPDEKTVALLSHRCIWLITNFNGNKLSSGKIYRVNLNHFSHKAGLCFASNHKIYIVDELELGFLGGQLYSFDLRDFQRFIRELP